MPLIARRLARAAVLLVATGALGACGNEKFMQTLGLQRDAPDEFRVTTRAPLSMPATFDLPPPQPGAPRPQELSERQQAEQALVPALALDSPAAAAPTPGQEAIVAAAGPQAPADIRTEVNAETARLADRRTFIQRVMFWQKPPDSAVVVDPEREAQRLRGNAALGAGVQSGDTAVEQPKPKSFIDSLF